MGNGAVFTPSDVKGKATIILSNRTYIDTANLQPRIQNQIRRLAAFSNPEFYKNQAIGISNYDESRYIYLGCDDNGYIGIPRGLTDTLKEKFDKAKISYNLDDKRCEGKNIEVSFKGELRDSQQKAVTEMLHFDKI